MVAMLHVALACAAPEPEQRPSMADVVRMIQSVPVPEEDRDASVTSPSVGVSTDDGGDGCWNLCFVLCSFACAVTFFNPCDPASLENWNLLLVESLRAFLSIFFVFSEL
jgi:hypothetical protein